MDLQGKHDEAERLYRELLDLSPGYSLVVAELVRIEVRRGRADAAISIAQQAVSHEPSAANLSTLAVANAFAGKSDEARALLTRLHELSRERWVSPWETSRIYAAVGDRDRALRDLRAAFAARHFQVPDLLALVPLAFEGLVGDPEFERLVSGINNRE